MRRQLRFNHLEDGTSETANSGGMEKDMGSGMWIREGDAGSLIVSM